MKSQKFAHRLGIDRASILSPTSMGICQTGSPIRIVGYHFPISPNRQPQSPKQPQSSKIKPTLLMPQSAPKAQLQLTASTSKQSSVVDQGEAQKISMLIDKMQVLQTKLSKVQEYVTQTQETDQQGSSVTQKGGVKPLTKVNEGAFKQLHGSQIKIVDTTISNISTLGVEKELDGIQQRIQTLNQRKEFLLKSLDNTVIERTFQSAPRIIYPMRKENDQRSMERNVLSKQSSVQHLSPRQVKLFQISQVVDGSWAGTLLERSMIFEDRLYDGQMVNGRYEGKGKLTNKKYVPHNLDITDSLGDICIEQNSPLWLFYDGSFQNNLFHGIGNLYLGDMYKVNGQFANGKADGRLTIINKKRNLICFIGIFRNGFVDRVILQKTE